MQRAKRLKRRITGSPPFSSSCLNGLAAGPDAAGQTAQTTNHGFTPFLIVTSLGLATGPDAAGQTAQTTNHGFTPFLILWRRVEQGADGLVVVW
jgi:hypothetical protein